MSLADGVVDDECVAVRLFCEVVEARLTFALNISCSSSSL